MIAYQTRRLRVQIHGDLRGEQYPARKRRQFIGGVFVLSRKRQRDGLRSMDFADGQNMHAMFHQYSVEKLKAACRQHMSVPGVRTRSEVYAVIAQAPASVQQHLQQTVSHALMQGDRTYARKKSRVHHEQHLESSRGQEGVQEEPVNVNCPLLALGEEGLNENVFMRAGSKDTVDDAVGEFIDRTGNLPMVTGVCAVCARETSNTDLTAYNLDSIPNPNRLRPGVAHPAHDVFYGMLLHPRGVTSEENANACMECVRALNADRMPPLALANGLWIGKVPHELAYLTLPERLLIAKYFPAAYIIKLYPKKKGARHWDKRQMYNGLKGNVSTYQLDQGQISSMIDGTILPQPPCVLAATIGITFVGPKNLPDKGLPDMFRIRRGRVQSALEWLKANNPLYANIVISTSRLADLPENDVPYELRATTKASSDITKLHAEQDGYVPPQEICDDDSEEGKV